MVLAHDNEDNDEAQQFENKTKEEMIAICHKFFTFN